MLAGWTDWASSKYVDWDASFGVGACAYSLLLPVVALTTTLADLLYLFWRLANRLAVAGGYNLHLIVVTAAAFSKPLSPALDLVTHVSVLIKLRVRAFTMEEEACLRSVDISP